MPSSCRERERNLKENDLVLTLSPALTILLLRFHWMTNFKRPIFRTVSTYVIFWIKFWNRVFFVFLFVCVKKKLLYFIVVSGCLYPNSPKKYDLKSMEKVIIHAKKNIVCSNCNYDLHSKSCVFKIR